MPFKVALTARAKGTDPEPLGITGVADPELEYTLGVSGDLDESSSPPVSKQWLGQSLALAAGTLTLDLEALTKGNLADESFTGLELTVLVVVNPAGNNPLTVTFGAANPYPIMGSLTAFAILTAEADAEAVLVQRQRIPTAVGPTASDIKFDGTGTETFSVFMAAG